MECCVVVKEVVFLVQNGNCFGVYAPTTLGEVGDVGVSVEGPCDVVEEFWR